jgi:hypothetical protein
MIPSADADVPESLTTFCFKFTVVYQLNCFRLINFVLARILALFYFTLFDSESLKKPLNEVFGSYQSRTKDAPKTNQRRTKDTHNRTRYLFGTMLKGWSQIFRWVRK